MCVSFLLPGNGQWHSYLKSGTGGSAQEMVEGRKKKQKAKTGLVTEEQDGTGSMAKYLCKSVQDPEALGHH